MRIQVDVLVNGLDENHKVYLIPGMNSKFVDQVEFLPVFEDPKHPKLQWVRKDIYHKSGKIGLDINE